MPLNQGAKGAEVPSAEYGGVWEEVSPVGFWAEHRPETHFGIFWRPQNAGSVQVTGNCN